MLTKLAARGARAAAKEGTEKKFVPININVRVERKGEDSQ
jgi:hypothetical protein